MATASAPGKLVLSGEYAVLDGAPALVMAVDRRAVARTGGKASADKEAGGLLDAVRRVIGTNDREPSLVLDTEAFHRRDDGGHATKLGLGSSAALTAALCRLLLPEDTTERAVFEAALAAHRQFQSGRGSGADVAASVAGGLLCYRMRGAEIERRRWPPALSRSVWWSGVPAGTAGRLTTFERTGLSPERTALANAAHELAAAWGGTDALATLDVLGRYTQALEAFDRRHGLDIFAAGHGDLASVARECGVVYKPCGAGAGDVGMAVAIDAEALARFASVAATRGFVELSIEIDPRGAELEAERT